MQTLYSVAIHPSDEIISLVKSMKEELEAKIKWFNSKNSVAHITINEFEATETEIVRIKKQLTQLCDTLQPVAIHFDSYGSYLNNKTGTFFIAPNELSKKNLKEIMKHVNDGLRVTGLSKSNEPHMSIARRLSPEKLAVANGLFPPIAVSFLCDRVVLRKFNKERLQFDVIDAFTFNGNPPLSVQGSLF